MARSQALRRTIRRESTLKPLVLGLVGAIGSGKTTIARALVAEHGFENFHMGRPLKDMLRALGLSEAAVAGSPQERAAPQPILDGKSARSAMGSLGTDWGRNTISKNLWANAVRAKIEQRLLEADPPPIVIDDLRFPSDWAVVSAFDGLIVRVRRPQSEPDRSLLDKAYHRLGLGKLLHYRGLLRWKPLHETEYHWRDAPCCADVDNTGSVDAAVAETLYILASEGRWTLKRVAPPEGLEQRPRPCDP